MGPTRAEITAWDFAPAQSPVADRRAKDHALCSWGSIGALERRGFPVFAATDMEYSDFSGARHHTGDVF